MDINNFFYKDISFFNKTYKTKQDALKDFAKILHEKKYVKNAKSTLELALKRENEFSTGIGDKIAIPHIRDDVVIKPCILFAKTKPCKWGSVDDKDVEFIFFIVMNMQSGENSHMDVIANLSRCFMKKEFIDEINKVTTFANLNKVLTTFSSDSEPKKEEQKNGDSHYDIVAITACPTGIAHTFMAAQKLEDAAKKMNLKIKVETQGTEGSRNTLSYEDITNAKGIILAVDKTIDLSRFSGIDNVLEISTSAVIKNAQNQINRSLNKEGTKMKGSVNSSKFESNDDLISFHKFGKRLYKSLMTGVSYMLPFVVFGGILIAIAFLIDIRHADNPLLNSDLGKIEPTAKWFKTLGEIAFGLMVPILSAYIAYAIVGKFGLLPGFITGMISNGAFLFNLNPQTGVINWLGKPEANSGFFGAILGAFLSAAIVIVFCKYIFGWLPKSLNGIKNILFIPLISTLVIAALFWILNIPLIYVNYGFTQLLDLIDKANLGVLLGLIIGLMMTTDLGGPINKAAYVFAITSLTTSSGPGTIAMASAMASGMVPPLGIAISCTLFRKLWTKEERAAGYSNYIMGLSFITEGAIPFTAEKPKVLVPANLIGGALTGMLTAAFGITLNAPHGGIFVFALVKSNLVSSWTSGIATGAGISLYLLSITIGAFASAFAIFFLSKLFAKKKETGNNEVNKINIIQDHWKKFTKIFNKPKITSKNVNNFWCEKKYYYKLCSTQ